jgi:hypothetical protein
MKRLLRWLAPCALAFSAGAAHSAATFQFNNADGPGEGLNDPAAFTAEGGNNATTLGEARLNVLNEAARIWGELINSTVPIVVEAKVDALTCTTNSATLAQAGTSIIYQNFPSAPRTNVYYPAALADALSGANLTAGSADLRVTINLTLHNDPNCFGGSRFYYGFDHNNPTNRPDLLQVLLHEIGHGLGISTRVDLATGSVPTSSDSIDRFYSYDHLIFDEALSRQWVELTAAERVQSATRTGFLAWDGASTNNWRQRFSAGVTSNGRLLLYAPGTVSQGSSVSHLDTSLFPHALMEPFRNNTTSNATDVTPCMLKDIGWTVTRCIDATNAVPVALAQTVTVQEDTPTTITLGGQDSDNDPLTFALGVATSRGTLSGLVATQPATVLFTPTQDATGADSFSFTVSDSSSISAAGTVTINIVPVNDPPVAASKTATVESGQSVGITLTGTDIDGDALTYTVVAGPASGTLSGTPPNVSYRSNAGFTGSDSFTYRVNDAALASAPVSVSITVTAASTGGGNNGGGTTGGGGGATELIFLALLAALLARSRYRWPIAQT